MKKFVVLYHSTVELEKQMEQATPEEKEEGMKEWMAWNDRIGDHMVDMGDPMFGTLRLTPDGEASAVKGNEIYGYSIVRARDLKEARSLFDNHPHLTWSKDVAIEMYECMEM